MKKFISFFLSALVTFVFTNPIAFAAEEVAVDLPCQYLVGSTVAETTIHGIIAEDGNLYVSPEEAAKVASFQFYSEENVFISQNSYTGNSIIYQLDVNTGKLSDQESPFYPDRTWEIPLLSSNNGSFSVSLNHLLAALNAEMKVDPSAETPLTIYRPFTVFDASTRLRNGSYFFEWTEIDETATQKDADWLYKLSALNSLFLDYNSHFVSDAAFAWWSDDVLNANEQQYLDSMIGVMTCFSRIDPSITDSIDYQTVVLQGEVFGLTNDMLELLGIGDEAVKLLDSSSNAIGIGTDILEQVSKYKIYRQISESQKELLRSTFLSSRSNSAFQDEDLEIIKNAAQHLQTLLDNSALGTATAVSDGIVKIGSGIVQDATPLALMDVASFIMSILPGTSQAVDINETTMLATHSAMLELFAREEYSRLNDEIREKGPSEDLLRENKETLLFALQASYATRDLFIQNQVFSSDVIEQLERKNSETLEFILFLQSCSTKTNFDNMLYQYNWDQYSEQRLVEEDHALRVEDLLNGYWGQNIQFPCVFRFREDGYAEEYYPEYAGLVSEDSIIATGAQYRYEIENNKLYLYYFEGGDPIKLELVKKTDDIEWDIGLRNQINSIPDNQAFLYETSWRSLSQSDPTGPAPGQRNAFYLSRWTESALVPLAGLYQAEFSVRSENGVCWGDQYIYVSDVDDDSITFTYSEICEEETQHRVSTDPITVKWQDGPIPFTAIDQSGSIYEGMITFHEGNWVDIQFDLIKEQPDWAGNIRTCTGTSLMKQRQAMFSYISSERAKEMILDYCRRDRSDNGTYIIYDEETIEEEDNYIFAVRYQISEQEAVKRLQEGRDVPANSLVGTASFNKEDWRIYFTTIDGTTVRLN